MEDVRVKEELDRKFESSLAEVCLDAFNCLTINLQDLLENASEADKRSRR